MSEENNASHNAPEKSSWPDLAASEWGETREAIHLWSQVVGKVRLALEPMVNQWWQVVLYLSARGLTTSLMHYGGYGLEMEFDFVEHALIVTKSDGATRQIPLVTQSVADFHRQTLAALRDLGVEVSILARPVEIEVSIPFAEDHRLLNYDPAAAHRFWLALIQAHRVMTLFRSRFSGKASPVHFFWGAADLATTRFSGRHAPLHPGGIPNCADWVTQLAYSHEVSSCGFWPGGSPGGSFYAYAYPEPAGFGAAHVEPAEAFYQEGFGEFLLPYEAVRNAEDPDATLLAFFQTTYDAAAELGAWDRAELEVSADRWTKS